MLDPQTLESLGQLVEPGRRAVFVGNLLRRFLEASPPLVRDLMTQEAQAEGARLAHKLCGMGGVIGALDLVRLCEAIETDLTEGAGGRAEELVARLGAVHEETLAWIRQHLATLDAA